MSSLSTAVLATSVFLTSLAGLGAGQGPLFAVRTETGGDALGDRWRGQGTLAMGEEARLLRAGVAYSLAGDNVALGRLRQRYTGFVESAANPEGLRVALSGLNVESLSSADFSRVTADNEAFGGWVAKMKDRFRAAKPAGTAPRG